MSKKNLKIPVKVGIWDTYYNIIRHRNGEVTLKSPYIDTVNDSMSMSTLRFLNIRVNGKAAFYLKLAFDGWCVFTIQEWKEIYD